MVQKNIMLFATAAIALIVVGLILSYGANITDTVKSDMPTETLNPANETEDDFAVYATRTLGFVGKIQNDSTFRVYSLNQTAGFQLLQSGNYTFNSTTSVFTLTNHSYNGSNLTWDYTYVDDKEARAAAANATKSLSNIAKNQPLVGTVIAGVVIVTLVLVAFGGFLRRRRS